MKYAVLKCVNGAFELVAEFTDRDKAIVNFHQVCMTLWNSQDVEKATVEVVNEKFEVQKIEYIKYNN